ncbi:MAG: sialidase family protein, partial [Acidimicrobiales bacterium]
GLVLAGVGAALTSDDEDVPRVEVAAGTNRLVTAGGDPLAATNSPALVASPTDPSLLVVAARVDRPELSATLGRSTDGGDTWERTELPLPPGEVRRHAPDLAFDAEGALYATYLTMSDPANNPTGVWLARSDDGGATFDAPSRVAGPYAYQPRVAVAGRSEAVYVTYLQASAAVESVRDGLGPPPNPVMVVASDDAGVSFSEPVDVSGDRERVGAATPFVGPDGDVFVLYQDFGTDAADFAARPGPVHTGPFSLVLARSADGGRTFSEASVVDEAVAPAERVNPYVPAYPSVAVDDSAATIYVAWSDATNDDLDVFVRRSSDGGTTWGRRVQVNPAKGGAGTHQLLPAVAVAPTGRVDVAFVDRGAGGTDDDQAGAALATSFDNGATWRTVVVSDRFFDARVGPESLTPGAADLGSRTGLVAQPNQALEVWTDSRDGTVDTGRQDLYFAPIRIVPEN